MSLRVAILSLHSHDDRSFLDDRRLSLVAGDLGVDGVEARLIVAVLRDEAGLRELARVLVDYDVVVYERVWSREIISTLREHVGAMFVSCEGEHRLADPPADFVCTGDLRAGVCALVAHLSGEGPLPRGVRARTEDGWREGLGRAPTRAGFTPALHPLVLGSPRFASRRTFSIEGNAGCPYGADARDNPAYAGVTIPAGLGRGCAFCTTGNRSESAPAGETAAKVMHQLRFLRAQAPELTRLVLKDQNPFGWLNEVLRACVEEGLGGFSVLLETRADWFLRNRRRFEAALDRAQRADIKICPFLVGIENFSQPELDRFNKGTSAAANRQFLDALFEWDRSYRSLDLSHAAFGFVLFTPWTTLADLKVNYDAVQATQFSRLRGQLLVSKARLYPDTALYYLAQRDGLLRDTHTRDSADNALRYGYFPETPWRFASPAVERFAEVAAECVASRGPGDEAPLFEAMLDVFEGAERPDSVTAATVRARLAGARGSARRSAPGSAARMIDRAAGASAPTADREARRGVERGGRDAVVRSGAGCDERCPVCVGTGPAADRRAAERVAGGGGRLTVRGDAVSTRALLSHARGWDEIRLHSHALESPPPPSVSALLVPLFSHVDAVHDRILSRGGALAASLAGIVEASGRGLEIDVEIPILPRRLSHPRSILSRVRSVTGRLRGVRFVVARGAIPASLAPPAWSEAARLLAEALAWCESAGVSARITRDQAIPICALAQFPELRARVVRFDPRREVSPAPGCARAGPCARCACAAQCPGVADSYRRARGFTGIEPLRERPRSLYHQRSEALRVWTDREREAARSAGLLVLRPTLNCNQDCLFCSANETSANVWTSAPQMFEQIARAADRGVARLAFGGGEPTLSRDLPSFVRAARTLGIEEVELVTNATLLDRPARAGALAEAGLTHAFVSLHAHDEQLSRHQTQKEGDFSRTVAGVHNLVGAGVRTVLNHVISTRNYHYLPHFVRFVFERFSGKVAISFAFLTPQYKALENLDLLPRMSEVSPHLFEALSLSHELGQPSWVGARQGIPPCQLGAFRAWSDIFEHADAGLSEDSPQKTRAPGCDRCAYSEVCTGVWRPYAARYGMEELQPIEREPFTERELAAVRRLKTQPWGLPPAAFDQLPDFLRDREAESALDRRLAGRGARGAQAAVPLGGRGGARFSPQLTRPLRVCLLGSSKRAEELVLALRSVETLSLGAVASPHVLERAGGGFAGTPTWPDAEAALDDMRPDAVIIAAAPPAQPALAKLCLSRGIPTLVSRPIAPTVAQLRDLLKDPGTATASLVGGYEWPHAQLLPQTASLHLTLGAGAPVTWSRRSLRLVLEDAFALALRVDRRVELVGAAGYGRPRPERLVLTLRRPAGAAGLRVEVSFGGGPRRLVSRGRHQHQESGLDAAPMLARFAEVAAGRLTPLLDRADLLRAARLAHEALGVLRDSGLPLLRRGAPRHVSSRRFRDGEG